MELPLKKSPVKARKYEFEPWAEEEGLRFEGEMHGGGNGEGAARRESRRRRPRGGSWGQGSGNKSAREIQGGGPDGGSDVPLQR